MTDVTINCSNYDPAGVRCVSTTYANARAGTGTLSTDAQADSRIGQRFVTPNYSVFYTFFEFDTSSIPADATITAATLKVRPYYDGPTTQDFTIEARVRDWGGSVSTADFVAGADLAGLTLVAEKAITSLGAGVGLISLDDVALAANINKGGLTRFIICSDRVTDNITPTVDEYGAIWTYHATTPSQLDVSYTEPTRQVLKPDADTVATGWATAPLYSKVDDDPAAPDGTVISATSS